MKRDEPTAYEADEKPASKEGGKRRYDDIALGELIQKQLRKALGAPGGEIAQLRARNLEYYSGEAVGELAGPDIPDRSTIVSTDVADTVEWMLPALMRVFAASPDAVEMEARSKGYAQFAKVAGEYMRFIFWKRCKGFNALYNLFKDGMMQKVGFLMVVWDEAPQDIEESYSGLLVEQVKDLLDDPNVTPLEQEKRMESVPAPDAESGQPPGQAQQVEVYDLRVKRRMSNGRCRIVSVPPEEMRIHARAKYGEEPLFIGREFTRTRADLEAEGYDLEDVGTGRETQFGEEQVVRRSVSGEAWEEDDEGELEEFTVSDSYIQLDQDMDGVPELRRVFMIGDKVFEDEQANEHPFVWFCPVPLPHAFFGGCPADQAIEPQRLGTSLIRSNVDNVYLTVNQRTAVREGMVNLDDVSNHQPGGIVRVLGKGPISDAMQPITQPNLGQGAWQMIEWAEQWRETRTGFTRYSKGLPAGSLSPDTATGATLITDRDDMRTELIARIAAESVATLMEKLMRCMGRYQDVADQVELLGEWMPVDPREWAEGFNVHVNVGLGTGNKDRRAQVLQTVFGMQQPLAQAGVLPPDAVLFTGRKFAEAADLAESDQYFPPRPPPPPPGSQPPPPPPVQVLVEQERGKQKMQQAQIQAQTSLQQSQAELQLQATNDQRDAARETAQAQMNQQLEALKAQHAADIARSRDETARAVAEINGKFELLAEAMRQHGAVAAAAAAPPPTGPANGFPQ